MNSNAHEIITRLRFIFFDGAILLLMNQNIHTGSAGVFSNAEQAGKTASMIIQTNIACNDRYNDKGASHYLYLIHALKDKPVYDQLSIRWGQDKRAEGFLILPAQCTSTGGFK